jgi:hypothetical protein
MKKDAPNTPKKFVTYRGRQMIAGWPEKIEEAQTITHYEIDGQKYARIPYGSERHPWRADSCRDCGALKGELHVPLCDVEICPKCGGQVIDCHCDQKIVQLQ